MALKLLLLVSVVGSSTGCGGSNPAPSRQPETNRQISANEHMVEARKHDRMAAQHASKPSTRSPETRQTNGMYCIDKPLAGVPYSGGQPLRVLRPCWTSVVTPDEYHRKAVDRHRAKAAAHRGQAKALLNTERQYCANLGEAEISQSPFWHVDDILSVEKYVVGGALRGARITFRRVRGLSVAWLRRASACHQARAAMLGYPRTLMTYCPLVLEGATFDVADSDVGYAVTIQSKRDPIAAVIWARAVDLLKARSAARKRSAPK